MNTEKKIKWAFLVTAWGKNATDTLSYFKNHKLKNNVISLVIYESEPCGAADLAKEMGIKTVRIIKKDYGNALLYQKSLIKKIKEENIDYIFLLGYKYRILNEMLVAFNNKIINIHPSLFPSFLGTKTAIQDAIDYGVKITGITTHIIDAKLDHGKILCQKHILIKKKDNFDSLYPKFSSKGVKIIIKTIKQISKLK